MRDKDLPNPAERFSQETMDTAEEMCKGLSLSLSIDKRGQATFHNGAVKALDSIAPREFPVTVCDVTNQPWYTLIGRDSLPTSNRALLVFRAPFGEDRRFVGRLKESRPGLRDEDEQSRYFSIFEPHEDASGR